MQTQGLLQESSLATLLQTMQTERATGALALESENDTASLFFLFGHLFHAAGPSAEGEDVVLNALSWHDGTFRFDPRAKLPPEETIKSSPAELIAEAERRTPEAPPAATEEQVGWTGAAYEAAWNAAAGPLAAQYSRVGTLRRGTLEVIVANSTLIQELGFQKAAILSSLNQQLPDQPVTDVRFRLGAIR